MFDSPTVGYADTLVRVIGKVVEAGGHREAAIEIRFVGGSSISVPLRDTERRCDEAATLIMNGGPIWSF